MFSSYRKFVDVSVEAKQETPVTASFAKPAPAAPAKAKPAPLDVALKSLQDHKDAGNDFMNKTQLIRKVNIAVQLGATFQVLDNIMKQHGVVMAKEVMASVANERGGQFKVEFDKANPQPVLLSAAQIGVFS